MKTRSWIAFAIGLIVLVLLVVYFSTPARIAPKSKESAREGSPRGLPAAEALVRASAPQPAVASGTASSSEREFERVCGVTNRQRIEIGDELAYLHSDWIEQRGLRAELLAVDGDNCRLFVPGLVLSETEIRETVLSRIANVVSEEKAKEIWENSIGRAYVLHELKLGPLGTDSWYDFKKGLTKDVRRKSDDSLAPAFSVVIRRSPLAGAPSYQWVEWETWNNAAFESIASTSGIGWNAASKAPAGYFRKEPILGVASRPPPTPFGSIDLDTGKAVMHNLRFRGSKDEVDIPEVAQPKRE